MTFSSLVVCLTVGMYMEARGEPLAGQVAVGEVILKRVELDKRKDNVCEVLTKKHQFTWATENGLNDFLDVHDFQHDILKGIEGKDLKEYKKLQAKAEKMLSSRYNRRYSFDHFYSGPTPYWAQKAQQVKIGNHYFLNLGG